MGAGHVLEDGIEDLLLDLCDGVTVEDLHGDLGAVHVVRVHTAQHLRDRGTTHFTEAQGPPGCPLVILQEAYRVSEWEKMGAKGVPFLTWAQRCGFTWG